MSTITTDFNAVTDTCCAKIVLGIPMDQQSVSRRNRTGTLDALLSPKNKRGFALSLPSEHDRPTETGTPSFRKVYTEGILPACPGDTTADALCYTPTAGTPAVPADQYGYLQHTVDMSIKRSLSLNVSQFKRFCKDPQTVMNDFISSHINGVRQEMNRKLVTKIVSYMGTYADGVNSVTTPRTVNVINPTADGDRISTLGFARIAQEYDFIGAETDNIYVGGQQLSLAKMATMSTYKGGVDTGETFTGLPSIFVDYAVDTDFDDDLSHLLSWAPGTFQMVTYNDINDDISALSVKNKRERMVIQSPFGDGFDWDVYFDVDETGCIYTMKWQLWFDVIAPVVYNSCAIKPAMHWIVGCGANNCDTFKTTPTAE